MGSYEPESVTSPAPLEPLPRLESIPAAEQGPGLDPSRVAEAFEVFHRQLSWYRAQATALPALIETGRQEARTDALKLIRAAAEFADVLERDAQEVAARQIVRVETEIRRREGDLRDREGVLAAEKDDLDRRRSEVLAAARREADEIVAAAHRSGAEARHEAELAKLRVLEEARRQVAELTNATRAEVEHTLEWSRAQAEGIVKRARSVAEQLLTAAMRGDEHVAEVVNAIVRSAESQVGPAPAALAPPPRVELPVARPAPPARPVEQPSEPVPLLREPLPDPLLRPAAPDTEPDLGDGPGAPNGYLGEGLQPVLEPVRFSWLPGGDRPAA
ncbi:MAG: hypothetical protein U0R69_06670 [Gaiellales bacterium]